MKKYLLLLVFICFLLLFLNKSYSFESCDNVIIKPREISTLNLDKYLKKNNLSKINYFCSYNFCYTVYEESISDSINNFNQLYYKELNEDDYNLVYVKGFPITQLSVNKC